MEVQQRKIYIEIVVDDNKFFDINKILEKSYNEIDKCERFDVIEKGSRTCYGQL
jgi:hypothetical protein